MQHLGVALKNNQVSRRLSSLFYSPHFHASQTLTTLELIDNSIGDEGAQHLGDTLKSNHVSRRVSVLFYSPHFHASQTLTTLNLEWNSIGDDGVQHLGTALKNNQVSRQLSLSVLLSAILIITDTHYTQS